MRQVKPSPITLRGHSPLTTRLGRNDLTDCFMKRTTLHAVSPLRTFLLCIMSMSTLNSCIHEGACDRFQKTLWHSSEVPLGPLDVSSLTLEFLSNGLVSIQTTSTRSADGMHICGHYEHNGTTAILQNLSFTIDDIRITFIEAEKSGDVLFLLWRVENMLYPFTTALNRADN